MSNSILAVCDLEESYACRLMDYLNLKKTIPFEVHAFTDIYKLAEYEKENKIDVLLISEEALVKEVIERMDIIEIMVLSEGKIIEDTWGHKSIYKYQSSENILREVMCYYAEQGGQSKSYVGTAEEVEFIGVYSPVKRTLKTSFALTLGQILAKEKRVLYINLEEYAGFNVLLERTYMTDLSDILYFISQKKRNFILKLASIVQSLGEMDYIPPALSPLDLKVIRPEEWILFLEELKKCNYDVIILDIGESIDGTFDILRRCSRIFTPIRDDGVSYAKIEQYEALLRIMEFEDILLKTRKISFTYFKGIEYGLKNLIFSDLGKYVNKILETEDL